MKTILPLLLLAGALLPAVAVEPTAGTQDIPDAVVRKVDPSVVAIQHERAVGSGFIVSPDGYILSNGHVVLGNDDEDPTQPAKAITVVLSNEQKFPARVIGFSMDPDVSLLKIEADRPLQPVEFADSRAVHVGQRCFAVGTPVGLKRTFTGGLLSNVERADLGTETIVFQTDAAINPGNSGGPLFDHEGRVLGINTYASQGNNNLGFTIPIHVAAVLKEHFLKQGRFVRAVLPYYLTSELYDELAQALGVKKGLLVSYVLPGSAAEAAGLRDGDVITELDGQPYAARTVAEALQLDWELMARPVGSTGTFTVVNPARGETRAVPFTLQAMEPMPRIGRHAGELLESRYDALGLGVRDLAQLQRIVHNLPPLQGVLVTTVAKSGASATAGLLPGDVVTAVGGNPTPNTTAFRHELEVALSQGRKYIEIAVTRRNLPVQTALAPHYLLRGRRVALLVPPREPEYVDLLRREMVAAGAAVKLYSLDGRPVAAASGPLDVQAGLAELNVAEMDVLLIAGGPGGRDLWDRDDVRRLVDSAAREEKTLAAVGPAALLLGGSGEPLKGRKITITKEDSAEAMRRGATYTGSEVETDGRVITTTGFDRATVRRFARELVRIERDR